MAKLNTDVLIVGGGIIGLTSAYLLAKSGREVTLMDRQEFGQEASWAGAGILPPGNSQRAQSDLEKVRAHSIEQLQLFSQVLREDFGWDNGYRLCSGTEFVPVHEVSEVCQTWDQEGIDYQIVRAGKHWLMPEGVQALSLPKMAQLRNPWHLRCLLKICKHHRVRLLPNTPWRDWNTDAHRIVGAQVGDGQEIDCQVAVIATGAWTQTVLEPLRCQLPIGPIRGQILLLQESVTTIQEILLQGRRYIVPRGDGYVLVGSTEEPESGFEKATTEVELAKLRDFALTLVPSLAQAKVKQSWAGLRPGSVNGIPYIDRIPNWENAFLAAGHFRSGVQFSWATAEILTDLVNEHPISLPSAPFHILPEYRSPAQTVFRS